ncbi:cyclophilin-like protein [Gigaspora margarita]|uniref:peptidylprolyl isomerase n=1 Tax=Gigaspora margarita TaxID=4874 RepID=A0A8H4A2G6_GIGMA|nr:cyclophilin-like protein [Gigaspora margarita]
MLGFGTIASCEIIRDKKTGGSLYYTFIEFENKEDCEAAYFKMNNVLIDGRRTKVDFSQLISKLHEDWFASKIKKARGVDPKFREKGKISWANKDDKVDNYENERQRFNKSDNVDNYENERQRFNKGDKEKPSVRKHGDGVLRCDSDYYERSALQKRPHIVPLVGTRVNARVTT